MSGMSAEFFTPQERELSDRFLSDGYIVLPVEDRDALDWIRGRISDLAAAHLGLDAVENVGEFLNTLHTRIKHENLNELRLVVIQGLNAEDELRARNFALVRQALQTLVGSELSMQRRMNLSIQMPSDGSSLLPFHSDVLNGDSPFEVVHWTPFVDVFRTKSMFLLPPDKNKEALRRLSEFETKGNEALRKEFEEDFIWLDVRYGETVLFNQNLFHGNIINIENETRWTMNCRYKGVFTPYADKKLGEFFAPITLRPASRIGMSYELPEGFESDN